MRELEAKFRVHPPFVVPELTGERTGILKAEPMPDLELRAVYWDTADLRLAREGITLRYRHGDPDGDGWHLKLPVHEAAVPDASTGSRDEIHAVGAPHQVPDDVGDLLTPYVRSAVLGPVATLVTTRKVQQLFGEDGTPVAEVTDDLVNVVNQGHIAGRFREIEVEDKGGGPELLHRVGEVLRAAGAVGGEFVPKVVRALGPQATGAPDPPPPGPVHRDEPVRTALQAVLRRYVREFMARDVALRRREEDAVHQLRVSARRLRAALRLFRPILDADWATGLRAELAWAADGLSRARDNEVLLARLQRDLDRLPPDLVLGPVRARIDEELGGGALVGAQAADETVHSDRYVALVDRLVDAAWEPMTTDAANEPTGAVLPALVGATWNRLAKDATRVRRPRATNEEWHRTRIAAKQVRYAADAVVPFYGKPAKALAAQAESVQDLLGEHQDAVMAAGVLLHLATSSRARPVGFTLGLLHAAQQDAIDRTRHEFPRMWAEVAKPKYRRWLRG